ncbi:hypothetical protein T265_05490 [Opisthorchis viverrini]|uniref:Uncharacterized protein n=1 Tax=Opisthorchis viverrini TaxID=6198 RepID=A0A075AF79_OPIVI|nr:hypothetical protein T265_05490 [Opisthorchis viverrini]KER27449.1 hypothetical protein T265_05490 [Opisthorchis viverrini]
MNLTVANSGEGSFITSLEGRQCIEYLARIKATKEQCKVVANTATHSIMQSKADHKEASSGASAVRRRGRNQNSVKSIAKKSEPDTDSSTTTNTSVKPQQYSKESREWELTKLRSFTLPFPLPDSPDVNGVQVKASDGSGLPTCVATGGPGGCWLAVGSDVGSVFLINRHVDPERNIVEPASRSHQLKTAHWLRRKVTDRKALTSASRLFLSRLGKPGSISALVLPLGEMATRHLKDATSKPSNLSTMAQCLERKFTDWKVHAPNPTSESQLLLSGLGHPGSVRPLASIIYPDVSGGLSSGVCSLALTSSQAPVGTKASSNHPAPLLATICDQPSWGALRVWRTDPTQGDDDCPLFESIPPGAQIRDRRCKKKKPTQHNHIDSTASLTDDLFAEDNHCGTCRVRLQPYALASCSIFTSGITPPPSPTTHSVTANSVSCPLYRPAVTPFRRLTAMSPKGSTRVGCPSLDEGGRETFVGFESRTFRSVNSRLSH